MKKLVDGIHRFQSGVFGEQKDLFARLSKQGARARHAFYYLFTALKSLFSNCICIVRIVRIVGQKSQITKL